jgi:hypothetical protein
VDKLPDAHEVIQWHDVPLPSQNLLTARDMILARVKAFVDGM